MATHPLAATAFEITLSDVAVIVIRGELVQANRQELKHRVLDLLQQGHKRYAVDFRECPYIDSTGLGVLVSIHKKIRELGGTIVVQNLNEDLSTLFALTKLDHIFTLEQTAPAVIP